MKLFVLPWANKCWDLSIKTVKFEIWPCVCTCTIVCIVRMFCTVSLKCDLVYVFVPYSVHCVCTCTIVCIVRRKSWKKMNVLFWLLSHCWNEIVCFTMYKKANKCWFEYKNCKVWNVIICMFFYQSVHCVDAHGYKCCWWIKRSRKKSFYRACVTLLKKDVNRQR